MVQHIGAPCEAAVSVGDRVKIGQPLGESKAFVCAPVHASVSGEVIAVEPRPLMSGAKAVSIVIRNDGKDEMVDFEPETFEKCPLMQFVKRSKTPESLEWEEQDSQLTLS